MARRLTKLRVCRVDLVERGASFDPISGEGSRVLLFKNESGKPGGGKPGGDEPPKCAACGSTLTEGAKFCPQCGAKVGEPASKASKPTQPGSGLAAPETPARRTRPEVEADIMRQAADLKLDWQVFVRDTPGGRALWTEYCAALPPRTVVVEQKAAPPSLDTLRRRAILEGGQETAADIYDEMVRKATEAYPREPSIRQRVALYSSRDECRPLTRRYFEASRKSTKAREQYAEAFALAELDPLVDALAGDGLERGAALAKALEVAPGWGALSRELTGLAKSGASVEAIERGSPKRRAMLVKLVKAASEERALLSKGIGGERLSFREALTKRLASPLDSLAWRARLGSADPEAASMFFGGDDAA